MIWTATDHKSWTWMNQTLLVTSLVEFQVFWLQPPSLDRKEEAMPGLGTRPSSAGHLPPLATALAPPLLN